MGIVEYINYDLRLRSSFSRASVIIATLARYIILGINHMGKVIQLLILRAHPISSLPIVLKLAAEAQTTEGILSIIRHMTGAGQRHLEVTVGSTKKRCVKQMDRTYTA